LLIVDAVHPLIPSPCHPVIAANGTYTEDLCRLDGGKQYSGFGERADVVSSSGEFDLGWQASRAAGAEWQRRRIGDTPAHLVILSFCHRRQWYAHRMAVPVGWGNTTADSGKQRILSLRGASLIWAGRPAVPLVLNGSAD